MLILFITFWEWKVEGQYSVGWPNKTWSKVVEEEMNKLNITKDMAEDRKQWRYHFQPQE